MEMKSYKKMCKSVFLESADNTVDAYEWHSLEGFNAMLTGNANSEVRAALSMRWEDFDLLVAAVSALRCED